MSELIWKKLSICKTFVLPILVFAIGLFLVFALVVWKARYTVASDERTDDIGSFSYGYKVEQYYFRNAFKLTFWSNRGMEFVHEQGQVTVESVEQLWLKDDAAIYFNMQAKYHDSVVSTRPVRIIFDFHRGEIHVSSGFTLWRNFDQRHDSEDWMSDTEFDAKFAGLQK